MFKAVKLRLYPNLQQEELLRQNAGCVRWVYNYFLDKRIKNYEKTGKAPSKCELMKQLPKLKKKQPWLAEVDSTSLQQTIHNLDQAYQNFFRRVKSGEKSGFPKFKKKGVRDSFRCVMNLGSDGSYLRIGKHGWIKCRGNHELLENQKIKSITVSLDASQWFASCLIELPDEKPEHIHKHLVAGVDVGVKKPLTVAYNDKTIVLGRKFSADLAVKEQRRKRYQRQLARKQKGSHNRQRAKGKVARAFQRERNLRRNWIEQTSCKLARTFETVKFEDLKLSSMTRSAKGTVESPGVNVKAKSGLNRELLRLGLSGLMVRTEQKAIELGGIVVYVNPAYTSQTCSSCGTIDKHSRKSQAKFQCVACGLRINADRNAAINILSS